MKSKFLITTIAIVLLAFQSCRKDDETSTINNTASTSYPYSMSVAGRVLNENSEALQGVTVKVNGKAATTDVHGLFVIKNAGTTKDRCVLHFERSGFFEQSHGFVPSLNAMNYVKIVMLDNTKKYFVSAATGGAVVLADQSKVNFPPNAFVKPDGSIYNGTVSVVMKHLSPGQPNFGFSIPGGDLLARNIANDEVVLYSYGMLGVTLSGSSGEQLQLGSGITAQLTVPIAAAQTASAPATLPLWYFDESASLWKEQGSATKVGNSYVGNVSHFTWWNCDYQGPTAELTGVVKDCFNNPVPNAVVTGNGVLKTTTNQNGIFLEMVPAGMIFTIQVLAIDNPGLTDSQLETTPVLTNNQIYQVPDLVCGSCPGFLTGTLTSCTRTAANAMVYVEGTNGFFAYQYSINGNYSFPVFANMPLIVNAINVDGFNQQYVAPISVGQTFNASPMMLCNNNSSNGPWYENGFVVNGNGFTNRVFAIALNSSLQEWDGDTTTCSIIGTDSLTNTPCLMYLRFPGNIIDTYAYSPADNQLSLDFDGTAGIAQYQSAFGGSQGILDVTGYDLVGGFIYVSFSGTLTDLFGNVIFITDGRMKIPRTQ